MNITFDAVINRVYPLGKKWMVDLLVAPNMVPVLDNRVMEPGAMFSIDPHPGRILWASWNDVMTLPLDGINDPRPYKALVNRPVVVEVTGMNDE